GLRGACFDEADARRRAAHSRSRLRKLGGARINAHDATFGPDDRRDLRRHHAHAATDVGHALPGTEASVEQQSAGAWAVHVLQNAQAIIRRLARSERVCALGLTRFHCDRPIPAVLTIRARVAESLVDIRSSATPSTGS